MTEITPVKNRKLFDHLRIVRQPAHRSTAGASTHLDHLEEWGKKSTVGQLMANLSNHLKMYGDREAVLVAEIADREEELRQVRASKRAVAGAMASLHGDVALTDDEAQKAEAAADVVAMEALDEDIKHVQEHAKKNFGEPKFVSSSEAGW